MTSSKIIKMLLLKLTLLSVPILRVRGAKPPAPFDEPASDATDAVDP
jgi:hypothetical protein